MVRLKGGDPFIFGRGGEELEHWSRRDIPVHVVPGITAALGCAAEAGLPLTFRKEATQALARHRQYRRRRRMRRLDRAVAIRTTTVVVYMGLSSAAAVSAGLIAAGRDPRTPAAVLARGTRPDSEAAVGILQDLPALAASVGEGPALLVVGDVVARSRPWSAATRARIEVAA